jgi:hypothetical protein
MDRLMDRVQLAGWMPARLNWSEYWGDGQPTVDWCYRSKRGSGDSSFDQIVADCLHHPFNLLFRHQTPIEVLGQWSDVSPGLQPTGFIFHMSRAGSNLISQTLAALPRNLVLSEARPIDSILRARHFSAQVTDEQRIVWLRWMVSALGQAHEDERQFFINFDAWNMSELPLIRRAFPGVPWVFVYGDPVEELTSQLNHRGAHMVPGLIEPSLFGINREAIAAMEPEEYCARVLAGICEAALAHYRNGGMPINKSSRPEAIWSSISTFFGVSCSENPALVVQKEPSKERATLQMRKAATKWLYPIYEELEAVRLEGLT